MASRLGPESSQGHNNWADIDEDDDDWAPDTITWTDGTKVTVHDSPQPKPIEPVPATVKERPRMPPPPTPQAASQAAPQAAPQAVPSPASKPATLPSGKGLILKGGSSADKPALVAKPPAPASPAKSPWAKLPPVEKASPVDPVQHGHLPVRDQYLPSVSPPPAREIAADDFSRSTWREGPTAGNRELYNSQSGRYEPVGDRRGSFRSDVHARQPPVLQRPAQSEYPEPSAAFQTNRTAQEGSFGRRRGSSNLSGGNFPPRPSFGAHDAPPGYRRGSITASIESANSPQPHHILPVDPGHRHQVNNQNWQPRVSPSVPHASPHPQTAEPPQVQAAPEQPQIPEDFEYQKRIMHEKRELAMQRRREQEAREEEEKQKRIQAKLAALGPAPERKSAKKDTSHEEGSVPIQIQQRQASNDSDKSAQTSTSAVDGHVSLPPGSGNQSESKRATSQVVSPADGAPAQLRGKSDMKPILEQTDGLGASAHANNPRSRSEGKPQWGQSSTPQPDRFTSSWVSAGQPPASSVWAPNNLRGLGNGTFNAHLGRGPVSPPTTAAQPARGQAPIAPPSAQRLAAQQANAPGSGREPFKSKWGNSIMESDRAIMEQNKARMAEQERELAERGMTLADSVPEIKDNWRPHNPSASLRGSAPDASVRSGTAPGSARPDYSTGTTPVLPQASTTPQSRSRFFPTPTRDARQEATISADPQRPSSPSPPPPDTVGHPAFDGDAHNPHVSLPRPQPVVRLPPSASAHAAAPASHGTNFSWSNPAPFKDAAASVPTGPAVHGRGWNRHPGNQGPAQHDSTNNGWDERFRNLFSDRKAPNHHKVTSPSQATFVDASSRSVFHEDSGRKNLATVSLPRTPTRPVSQQAVLDSQLFLMAVQRARKHLHDNGDYMVKPVSEECFEAQEMGSLPSVKVPRETPEAAWHPAPAPPKDRNAPRRLMNSDISSSPLHWVAQDIGSNGSPEYRIKFPGMDTMRTVPAPALRSRSNPRRGSSRGTRSSQAPRGGKNTDSTSQSGDAPPPSRPSRGGRGSYRGRGSDWSRRTSSAQAN